MKEILEIFRQPPTPRFLFFLVILCSLFPFLYLCFVLATTLFSFYQFLLITAGIVVVWKLITMIPRSRYRLWRYGLRILIVAIILYVSFLTIPQFNFFIKFNTRQQIVNRYFQQNIKVENSWLGETTYYPDSVYFTYFKASGRSGSRVFLFIRLYHWLLTG